MRETPSVQCQCLDILGFDISQYLQEEHFGTTKRARGPGKWGGKWCQTHDSEVGRGFKVKTYACGPLVAGAGENFTERSSDDGTVLSDNV